MTGASLPAWGVAARERPHAAGLVALTIALWTPSPISFVNVTDTSAKPTARSPATYSETGSAPAMQPT